MDNISTYDVEHDVVTQTRGAVDADEDAVFDGGAKAHSQPVSPRARPLIIGPRVCDQTPSFTKDICGASCGNTRSKKGKQLDLFKEKQRQIKGDWVKFNFMIYKLDTREHSVVTNKTLF